MWTTSTLTALTIICVSVMVVEGTPPDVAQCQPNLLFEGIRLLLSPTHDIDGPNKVVIGDINGDGNLDALVAATGSDGVRWIESNGDMSAVASTFRVISYVCDEVFDTQLFDADQDGDLDVVVSCFGSDSLWVYLNTDGAGDFSSRVALDNAATSIGYIVVDDLNGDVRTDVVAASDPGIFLYANGGAGSFLPRVLLVPSPENSGKKIPLALGDLTGDGLLDLVVGTENSIFYHAHSGGLGGDMFNGSEVSISDLGTSVSTVALLDADQDGDLEVVVGLNSADQVALWENTDGEGTFSSGRILITNRADNVQQIIVADLDSDGWPDLVSASQKDNRIAWYRNQKDLSFSGLFTVSRSVVGAVSVAAGSLTASGRMDLLALSFTNDELQLIPNADVAGEFFSTLYSLVLSVNNFVNSPIDTAIADFDGDGDLDVAFALQLTDEIGTVTNFDGLGGFLSQVIFSSGDAKEVRALGAADLDGDGDIDLLSCSSGDNKVAWYTNDGLGVFGEQRIISDQINDPRKVVPTDLDRDGDWDLIVAGRLDNSVVMFDNLGGGSFGPPVTLSSGDVTKPLSITLANVSTATAPGRLDLLVGGFNGAYLFPAVGLSGFGPPVEINGAIGNVHQIAVADINRDGYPDCVTASAADDTITWHANVDGTGGTWGSTLVGSGNNPRAVLAGDLDDDGDIDFVGVFRNSDRVVYFVNLDGYGVSFDAVDLITSADVSSPTSASFADINGDGALDLVVTSFSGDAIRWVPFAARSAFATYTPKTITPSGMPASSPCRAHPRSFACVADMVRSSSRCVRDTVLLPPGRYSCRMDSHLDVSHRVEIRGDSSAGPVIFDCASPTDPDGLGGVLFRPVPHPVFSSQGLVGDVVLANITVVSTGLGRTSATGAPGLRVEGPGAKLTLSSVNMTKCASRPRTGVSDPKAGTGGCVLATNGGAVRVEASECSFSHASRNGGCVAASEGGKAVIVSSTFEACVATGLGGAVFAETDGSGGVAVVSDSRFVANTGGGGGGLAFASPDIAAEMGTGGFDLVVDVPSSSLGVPLATGVSPDVVLSNVVLDSNVGTGYGGGVFVCGTRVQVSGQSTVWRGNRVAGEGGTELSESKRASWDAMLCVSSGPPTDPSWVPLRTGGPSGLPWLEIEGSLYEGSLSGAAIHSPVTKLEWSVAPPGSVQAGLGVEGRLDMTDWFGQAVEYGNALVRFSLASPVLDPGATLFVDMFVPSREVAVVSPRVIINGDFAASIPTRVGYNVGLLTSGGTVVAGMGGSMNVTSCLAGHGVVTAGTFECVLCPGATTTFAPGFAPCAACPTNSLLTTKSGEGGSNRTQCLCERGFFQVEDSSEAARFVCLACPPGGVCTGGSEAPFSGPGFYALEPGSSRFVPCVREGCVGNSQCAAGYTGFLCSSCAEGYFSESERVCQKCPSIAGSVVGMIVVVVVAGGVAAGLALSWSISQSMVPKGDGAVGSVVSFRMRTMPVSVSLIFVTCQVLGVFASLDVEWGPSRGVLNVFNVVNFDAQSLGAECSLASFYTVYVFATLGPLVFLFVAMGTGVLLRAGAYRMVSPWFDGLEGVSVKKVFISIGFSVFPVVFLPLARASLVVFDCSLLPGRDGSYVLDADNGVACFDDAWWSVFPFALIVVLVFVVGAPLYFAYALVSRRDKLFTMSVMTRFGSLYRNFRRDFFLGEMLSLAKRLFIVVVAMFLSQHQVIQLGMILVLLGGWVVFLKQSLPYFIPLYNGVDTRLTLCLISILMLGAGSYAERQSASSATFLLVCVVVALVVLGVIAVHAVVVDVSSLRSERQSPMYSVWERQRELSKSVRNGLKDLEGEGVLVAGEVFLGELEHQGATEGVELATM